MAACGSQCGFGDDWTRKSFFETASVGRRPSAEAIAAAQAPRILAPGAAPHIRDQGLHGWSMRLAVPIWNDRLSPVFDVAGRLLVVSIQEGRETYRFEAEVLDLSITRTCQLLKLLDIDLLICGAISTAYLGAVQSTGITVIAGITGTIEAVIAAHIRGRLMQPQFFLPGRETVDSEADRQPPADGRSEKQRRQVDEKPH